MSRVYTMQTAFNGGELSPFMLGRPDHEIYPVAVASMVGWAPRPQGPAEACPGFEFVELAPGPCRLLPFEPSVTQGYVVEASNALFRFYTNDVLLTVAAVPVTVVAPYTFDQLAALDYEHSIDVMYLFHGEVQTQLLERTAADAFALGAVEFENGPFLDRNTDETLTLSFSGVTGSGVTCTASAALFAATDVGRWIEIEAHDLSDVPSWQPGITTALGNLLQWDGRVYQVTGGAGATLRTGTVAPVHTRGVEWDGTGTGTDVNDNAAGGVELAYMFDMFGRVKITGYTSATVVTCEVKRTLPFQAATGGGGGYTIGDYLPSWYNPDPIYDGTGDWTSPGTGTYTPGTWRWRLGAYSDTTGWPTHGRIAGQRLLIADAQGRVSGSVVGDLLNFDRLNELGEVSIDQAFTFVVDEPAPVTWLHNGDEIFIATEKAEYVLRAASAAAPLGPGNIKLARQSKIGSAAVRPVDSDSRPIFVQRNRRKLIELTEGTYARYESEDLTRYADHIGDSPLNDLTWQREPLQLLWGVREDGVAVAADYLAKEAVLGWFRRPLADGLDARSVCAITSPDGMRDQLWCAAEVGAAWWVMRQAPWRNSGDEADPLAVMLDGALTYDGAPVSTLSAPHLAGRNVEVVGDGVWLGTFPADGSGDIALGQTVEQAVTGLAFASTLTLLPPEAGGDNGPAQGRMKRVNRLTLRLHQSLGLRITYTAPGSEDTVTLAEFENLTGGTDLAAARELFSGDLVLDIVGGWDREGKLTIERFAPFPNTLLAAMAHVETEGR